MKKKILVSVDAGETRVAVFERKGNAKPKVGELYVERRGSRSIVGNIYKGVVDNVLPGMEAAFVDIGLERNGFLHVDEIVLPGGEKVPRRGHGKAAPYGCAGSAAASTRSCGSSSGCRSRSRSTAPGNANCAPPSPSTKYPRRHVPSVSSVRSSA